MLIILKTILSANNHFINRKLGALNNSLFRRFNTFYHSRLITAFESKYKVPIALTENSSSFKSLRILMSLYFDGLNL